MRKILACVDGSELSGPVVREAFELLEERETEGVEILHVVEKRGELSSLAGEAGEPEGPSPDALKRIEAQIGNLVAQVVDLDRTSVSYSIKVMIGSPYKVILQRSQDEGFDLVLMGHRGVRGMHRFFLGSVAAKVVAYAPCHALVLRSVKSERPSKVMVAVDGGETSAKVMAFGLDHALRVGASEVLFLNVVEEFPGVYQAYWGNMMEDPEYYEELSRKRCEEMKKTLAEVASSRNLEGVTLKTEVAKGRTHATIIRVAESEGIDLVVVGDRGKHGFEGFLLGSVSAKIVRYAHCGVLVFRTGYKNS